MRSLACFVFLVALIAVVPGCADNPTGSPDGSSGGMDSSMTMNPDGGGPVGSGPCGTSGGTCCVGRICELGLDCGRGDICCIQPGSGTGCDSASDCCRGLACNSGRCCAPRMASCGGSSDCCDGLVCTSSGVCAAPGDVDAMPDTCGRPGQRCCDGFTCAGEVVCTEGMCESCGGEGEACCDGASPCTSPSLACDVTTATCVNADPTMACGEIDRPCCDGPDGTPTDCSGDMVCRGGTCLRPDDVGFMGAPCGPRGTCDPGLVCDRRMDPSGLCETTPEDCGRDGQMCCDLGGSMSECDGSLHCQFGDCTACRGPSLTCLLGGLLPGQECCAGSVCRPAPLIPRCCMGQGGDCENSLDCCGLMFCGGDGTCSCGRDGSFCLDSSECCEGTTCQTFMCRPSETTMCEDTGAACESGSECCAGLACSETRTEPTARPVRQCCAGGSTSCEENEDCCGRMLCEDGECECVPRDGLCDRDIECCGDDICLAGSCQDGTGCRRETVTCDPTANECCGALRCSRSLRMDSHSCCVDRGVRCRNDMDCCGNMTCDLDTERCTPVPEGSACDSINDCEDGVGCTESSPGAGDYTCRRATP